VKKELAAMKQQVERLEEALIVERLV